jgi:hypothetical protein
MDSVQERSNFSNIWERKEQIKIWCMKIKNRRNSSSACYNSSRLLFNTVTITIQNTIIFPYLEDIVAAPGLENRSYDRRNSLRWPRDTLYPLKLTLASLTGGDRSIGIVR